MSDDQPKTDTSLLLDIYQQMGRVEGQNELILKEQARAAKGRKDIYNALDKVRIDVAAAAQNVAAVATRVTSMEPDVGKMKGFRAQAALAVVFVTAVVTGAFNLVFYGVTHFSEIKGALRGLLH